MAERAHSLIDETREDLQELPAYLLALVLALGLGCGVLVNWIGG